MDSHKVVLEALIRLVRYAMYDSKDAHEMIFDKKNQAIALTYLGKACSQMCAAEAIYYSNIETLESFELPEIFHQFRVFYKEVIKNYATNHSHQWSDIEFNRFKDLFDKSACAFENQ